MALAQLDSEAGCSISKFLKKSFKKFNIEKKKAVTRKECVTIFEELYAHTGADSPANWEKKVQSGIDKVAKAEDLTIDEFCVVLRESKFWETLEKKGNIKAKKLVGDTEKAAIALVVEKYDDVLEPSELEDAYTTLGKHLDKKWDSDAIASLVDIQLTAREKKKPGPIGNDEFVTLCIAGPFRHFELKPSWWTKLGKKKGKKDTDAMSAAPSSLCSDQEDPEPANRLLRIALQWKPPMIVFEYQDHADKTRHRKMYLSKHLDSSTDCKELASKIASGPNCMVAASKMERLLLHIQGNLNETDSGAKRQENGTATIPSNIALTGENADFNHLDDEELKAVKAAMDEDFERNRIKIGDPDYVHDVRKDFAPPIEESGWDSD